MMSLMGHDGDHSDATHAIKYRSENGISWFVSAHRYNVSLNVIDLFTRVSSLRPTTTFRFHSHTIATEIITNSWMAWVSAISLLIGRHDFLLLHRKISLSLYYDTTPPGSICKKKKRISFSSQKNLYFANVCVAIVLLWNRSNEWKWKWSLEWGFACMMTGNW